VTKFKTVHFFF